MAQKNPRLLLQIASAPVWSNPVRLLYSRSTTLCACPSLRGLAHRNSTGTTPNPLRALSTTPAAHSASPFRLKNNTPKRAPPKVENEEYPYEEEGEDVYYSPYQPKRQWPPDMSKLSPKHQLRLERKYRRRAALKYARPRWVKATKLFQWGAIIFTIIYSALFLEWGKEDEEQPFKEFRQQFFDAFNSIISTPQPPGRRIDNKEDK